MTYKSILLPVTSDRPENGAAQLAATLARKEDGVLRLLYPRGESIEAARFRYPTLGESFFVQVEEASRESAESREQEARSRLEKYISTLCSLPEGKGAPPRVQWEPINADSPEAVRLLGGLYDLLVLDDQGRANRDLVETVLFQTGRPVLLVPDDAARASESAVAGRAMIGWNRSTEAGRAVVAALPLLQQAETVVICTVRTAAKQGPESSQLAEYLAHHGVTAEIVRPEPGERRIGAVLLDTAAEQGADLLVAGANYGARLRRLTPGGVTAHLLQHARLPILLAH